MTMAILRHLHSLRWRIAVRLRHLYTVILRGMGGSTTIVFSLLSAIVTAHFALGLPTWFTALAIVASVGGAAYWTLHCLDPREYAKGIMVLYYWKEIHY